MLSTQELKKLFNIFKTGTLENIGLAIELAKGTGADLRLNQFEDLASYLDDLNVLSLKECSIVEKIHTILNLEELSLKIKDERKSVISANLYLLRNLKKLSINAEIPVWIPHTLSYFEHLEELDIQLQDQDQFPKVVCEITSLQKLDLSCNLFHEIPRTIWQLRKLKELNLCFCINLNALPNELFSLPVLEKVLLFQTGIDEISPLIAYSPIKVYCIIMDETMKKVLADPAVGRKLLQGLHKEQKTLFNKAYSKALKQGNLTSKKINNVPPAIESKGIEAIKEYFKYHY